MHNLFSFETLDSLHSMIYDDCIHHSDLMLVSEIVDLLEILKYDNEDSHSDDVLIVVGMSNKS
tara:strand:- start:310 stop:498 length:189 start_codon:yes stop_codon:yes gene_type:complete